MKLRKKLAAIMACGLLAVTGVTGISASAATTTVDNDDGNGYSNYQDGFYTYLTSSYHYLGDSRRQSTGNNQLYYHWELGGSKVIAKKKISLKLYAYVNDSSFNDPAAQYKSVCMAVSHFAYLNQNTAAGGWNLVATKSLTPSTTLGENSVTLFGARVSPNSTSGYNTGADGIRFTTTVYNS